MRYSPSVSQCHDPAALEQNPMPSAAPSPAALKHLSHSPLPRDIANNIEMRSGAGIPVWVPTLVSGEFCSPSPFPQQKFLRSDPHSGQYLWGSRFVGIFDTPTYG
ncbi:hypothetical protein PIB30_044926 [Stylosanthes scabra]|uniref:Uncharacterized protein n=1 Tax=Stylosanthes scabra TaxID=79078 RepID=A0ABU6YEU0_9FABA|nr:hypothetical protein [Stylosanthes scabra]